jgi:hypothetical protein
LKEKVNCAICKLWLLIAIIIFPLFAVAQDPGDCPDCPIDGGLGLLIAAGVGYGVKKYRDRKKETPSAP